MAARSLRTRILISSFAIILVLSLSIALLGSYVIKIDVIERAERKVRNDLEAARLVYTTEIQRIGQAFELVPFDGDIESIRKKLNLDYLRVVGREWFSQIGSEIVNAALLQGKNIGGTRIISEEELEWMNDDIAQRIQIDIKPTPMARPDSKEVLAEAMAWEYAMPILNETGEITAVVYGGRIINKNCTLVDRIRELAFGSELYDSKPVGTVTIFQDDVRISTNVLNKDSDRAIGTRVSEQVYRKVVEEGQIWHARAFVVTDWYKTAYEPIRNIDGEVVGMLYVGILEQPFNDMARNIFLMFFALVAGVSAIAAVLSFILAKRISKPLTNLLEATARLSRGDLGCRIETQTDVRELIELAEAFNSMSGELDERDHSLRVSNEELAALNETYLNMVGFVSHELKGSLATPLMNAYVLRDGFLGVMNPKQRQALDSIVRNLEYQVATVKRFLNLSRIENGELELSSGELCLQEDVFTPSLQTFAREITEKQMEVINNIQSGMQVNGDVHLLLHVANNLIGNAVKYGSEGGKVILNSEDIGDEIKIEIYNDSKPIRQEEKVRLFKRFSRLDRQDEKRVKGTGLGLFIAKEIITKHGGDIWVEPREGGNSFIFRIKKEGSPDNKSARACQEETVEAGNRAHAEKTKTVCA